MWRPNVPPFTIRLLKPDGDARGGLRALLLSLLMAVCAIPSLASPQRAANGQSSGELKISPPIKVQGLVARTGKLLRMTDLEAVVAVDQAGGKPPLNTTFALATNLRSKAAPGDRVDLMFAPSTPRNVIVVLTKVPKWSSASRIMWSRWASLR